MAKYLMPSQYKRFGDGISLSDVSDMTLAFMITRAEAAIDAHMGFDIRRGGFEPHSIMFQQAFNENNRKTFFPQNPVPLRQVTRYRIQVSNVSTAGAGFYANISPADCAINNDGDYVEIVPLQAVTYALSPVLMQFGLKPPIVEMDCNVGFYFPTLGEQLISDGQGKTFYATNGFWATTYDIALPLQPLVLPPVPPVVYLNGSIISSTLYTVNAIDGSVTFTTPRSNSDIVTADYTYTIPDFVQEACVLQTSHLLARRALNEMKMFKGLYMMRAGEQQISYPRAINVTDQGRTIASSLSDDAAAVLARYEVWGIA